MNIPKIISCLSISLLFSGCALSGKIAKKESSTPEMKQVLEIGEIKPDIAVEDNKSLTSVPVPLEESPVIALEAPPKKFNFTGYDMQHVRTVNHNPFEDSDTLCIFFNEDFCFPLPGAKAISQYMTSSRRSHTGVDLKTFAGDTIRAVFPGVVRMSQTYGGYGKVVVIRHYNGLETVYSHNSKNLVHIGDCVTSGQPIALTGRTGRATTEHVHFEVRVMGEHINPNKFFDFAKEEPCQRVVYLLKRPNNSYAFKKPDELRKSSKQNSWTAAASAKPDKTVETSQVSSIASSEVKEYKVQKGDTLYAIARKYNTTLDNLCKLNNITLNKILQVGMKLRVR